MKPPSLKRLLLLSIVPVLLVCFVVDMWSTAALLRQQAQAAYDRSLAGVLRAIDASISTESGGLALVQPYQLLDFFEFTASGKVYYRVATEDGLVELGHAALPLPIEPLVTGQLRFYDASHPAHPDMEAVRVAVLARDLAPPLSRDTAQSQRVIIQVAESLEPRRAYTRVILWQLLWRGTAVIVLTAALLVVVVMVALRPLQRLRHELQQRSPEDVHPIPRNGLPAEVQPLVDAINYHIQRRAEQTDRQRQFLDDAAHQLRTPLAVLRTQLAYAQREKAGHELQHTLAAMCSGLERATRVTNQMLALARAHGAALPENALTRESFCLNTLLEDAARLLAPAARARQHDYGLEVPQQSVHVQGFRLLLQEAIINLLDNAIAYSPVGSTITLGLYIDAENLCISVQDNGPGMAGEDIEKAGVRFRRGAAGKNKTGAGLGLAIVQTIVQLHGGKMQLHTHEPSHGFTAKLVFSLDCAFLRPPQPV